MQGECGKRPAIHTRRSSVKKKEPYIQPKSKTEKIFLTALVVIIILCALVSVGSKFILQV